MRINSRSGRWWFDIRRLSRPDPFGDLFEIRQWPENLIVSRHRTMVKAEAAAKKRAERMERRST